jgi:thiol-disulfide isomerase/thioredoxin
MKLRILLAAGGLIGGAHLAMAANEPAANQTSAPVVAPAVAPVEAELNALVAKIKTKLQTGERTEAALADELRAFDALIAAHRDEKSDAMAQAAWMRAALYLQVFANYDKAGALLKEITTDFPGSRAATNATAVLAKLDAQKESLQTQAALKPGAAFPDFDEKDLAGAPLSIGKFKGKVVLVDFWATWCGPCVAELPNVLAAYEKYHSKGFEIVGISLDQSESKLKGFLSEQKMTWPQYFDGKGWESKLGHKYGVTSIPATYLLDGDGRIIAKDLRGEALDAELARLLAK